MALTALNNLTTGKLIIARASWAHRFQIDMIGNQISCKQRNSLQRLNFY